MENGDNYEGILCYSGPEFLHLAEAKSCSHAAWSEPGPAPSLVPSSYASPAAI